jgi:acetyl esterase/lipase
LRTGKVVDDNWAMNNTFLFVGLVFLLLPTAIVAAELRSDIEYGTVDGESLKLDASVPDGAGPFPVVIVIHGGGWSGGDKAQGMQPLVGPLTDAGFTWFLVNYRLAPAHRWPACYEDVCEAIRWVKAHAAEYKGDPTRVALLGYSAGGHLAAQAVAKATEETWVQAVVLFAAPTSLEGDVERREGLSPSLQKLFDHGKEVDDPMRTLLHETSPINFLSANSPPCLLLHGTEDKSVAYSQSENFKARLDGLYVPCELITISGGDHHIDQWNRFDSEYGEKMVAWLNKTLAAGK